MSELTGIIATYPDGDVIFREGDAAADMFVVRSGAVDIVRENESGREVLERVRPGEFFGELALFDHQFTLAQVPKILGFHSCPLLMTNLVAMGSL